MGESGQGSRCQLKLGREVPVDCRNSRVSIVCWLPAWRLAAGVRSILVDPCLQAPLQPLLPPVMSQPLCWRQESHKQLLPPFHRLTDHGHVVGRHPLPAATAAALAAGGLCAACEEVQLPSCFLPCYCCEHGSTPPNGYQRRLRGSESAWAAVDGHVAGEQEPALWIFLNPPPSAPTLLSTAAMPHHGIHVQPATAVCAGMAAPHCLGAPGAECGEREGRPSWLMRPHAIAASLFDHASVGVLAPCTSSVTITAKHSTAQHRPSTTH